MPCKEEAELSAEAAGRNSNRRKGAGKKSVVINIAGKYSNTVSFAIVCFTTCAEATNKDPRSKGAPNGGKQTLKSTDVASDVLQTAIGGGTKI